MVCKSSQTKEMVSMGGVREAYEMPPQGTRAWRTFDESIECTCKAHGLGAPCLAPASRSAGPHLHALGPGPGPDRTMSHEPSKGIKHQASRSKHQTRRQPSRQEGLLMQEGFLCFFEEGLPCQVSQLAQLTRSTTKQIFADFQETLWLRHIANNGHQIRS